MDCCVKPKPTNNITSEPVTPLVVSFTSDHQLAKYLMSHDFCIYLESHK